MLKAALCLICACALAILAGPFAFAASYLGKPDPNELYLVFDFGLGGSVRSDVIATGARAVGPQRGILAEMFHAPPGAFETLVAAGYVVLPAGQLAALCGVAQAKTVSSTESI